MKPKREKQHGNNNLNEVMQKILKLSQKHGCDAQKDDQEILSKPRNEISSYERQRCFLLCFSIPCSKRAPGRVTKPARGIESTSIEN